MIPAPMVAAPRTTASPTDAADDTGLSLIELLIATFVGSIVLALVAMILTTTLQATAATRDRDLATGRVQAVSSSLSTSLRNAADVDLRVASGRTVLRARIADGASSWQCRVWAVGDLDADGTPELRLHTHGPLGATDPVPQPATSWGVLADRVAAGPDAALFAVEASADPASDLVRVTWSLEVTASEHPQLADASTSSVAGSAAVSARSEGGSARCW